MTADKAAETEPTPPAKANNSHTWTVIGSIAGIGSLIAAVLFYAFPADADRKRPFPQTPEYDACLIGTWVHTPRIDGSFVLADGRSFVIRAVRGTTRYYFKNDGTGATEEYTELSGEMPDGRGVVYTFTGRSSFRYSAVEKRQLIYHDPQEKFAASSRVDGEKLVIEPTEAFTANDQYSCRGNDLVLINAAEHEYRLRKV